MSDSSAPVAPKSLQLIVEGDEKTVTGFIRGLFIGAKNADWPVFHDELGIESETLAEQLKGWVGLTEPLTHFVVDPDSLEFVRAALTDPRCHGLRLRDATPVLGASFTFEFAVFTREAAAQVRAIFERLPPDVILQGWAPKETAREPSAQGVELYSPVHHYKLEGKGAVSGPFRRVLYVHEQARRIQQIDESKMKLEMGEPIV